MLGRIAAACLAVSVAVAATTGGDPASGSATEERVRSEPYDLDDAEDAALRVMNATEIKADTRGHFRTSAEIDGTEIAVMVDTGASAVALSYEDADEAGLRPHALDYDVPVGTANGVAKAARVMLRRVEVDGVTVRNVEGLVLPEGMMAGTLLGMSFLSRLRGYAVEDGVLRLED